MFKKISDVPIELRKYYMVETTQVPKLDIDGAVMYRRDKSNDAIPTPIMVDTTAVVLLSFGETKTLDDVHHIIKYHRGRNDIMVELYYKFYTTSLHKEYHDDYIEYLNDGSCGLLPRQPTIIDFVTWKAENYHLLREAAYPNLQEQLDMQYHDTINGTTTWKDTVTRIKEQYPKPTT